MKKKLIALSVCCAMLCGGMLPVSAETVDAIHAEETFSGSCGSNVRFSLNTATGVMKITGSGKMADYTDTQGLPWDNYISSIKSVEVGSGVTSVGEYAFYECEYLQKVTLSADVLNIGEYAFANTSLKTVSFRSGLKTIGRAAFMNTALETVKLPNTVEDIGAFAFSNCGLLKVVKLSNSMNRVTKGAFKDCICLESVNIPNNILSIEPQAFEMCMSLPLVTLPPSVHWIEQDAFDNCRSLKRIIILDPECQIYDSDTTICNEEVNEYDGQRQRYYTVGKFNGVICGERNSDVQSYALQYNKKFSVVTANTIFEQGDTNLDGKITADDAQLALSAFAQSINGLQPALDHYQTINADVDENDEVTAMDAQYILTYFLYNNVLGDPTSWDDIIV